MIDINTFINENKNSIFKSLKELCSIPAPTHFEHKRAEYCKSWLKNIGAKNVYIDEAENVIFPINCENSDNIIVFAAHTDTVFPDKTPMMYFDDGEKIYSPGVCDDTASVVVLLHTAKYFVENKIGTKKGIMFLFNSCEEGLGNLKGVRTLFKNYDGRISRFITFDGKLNYLVDECVGSHRYEVEVLTEGGHSFSRFGSPNAIAELSNIISNIYKIKVPEKMGAHTTYNVGEILGGTSVNTIAQSAKMKCEYRSNDRECLLYMQNKFFEIFDNAKSNKVEVKVTKIGDRPCGNIDKAKIEELKNQVISILEGVIDEPIKVTSGSTDCNIPLSLGIPAICVGGYVGDGEHTREEWLKKDGFSPCLEFAIKLTTTLSQ